jgi:hypothetical protein
MGIRCQCSVTATASSGTLTAINGTRSFGRIILTASICPNCSPNTSFINITYFDNDNQNFNFTFTSTFVDLPDCDTPVGGVTVSAQGVAVGAIFNGPATLSEIQFIPGQICEIELTANNNLFEQLECINADVVITPC